MKSKSLLEQAYSSIKDFIITGSIEPGEKLIESRLAETIGLSRTPVREALRRLELEGLVTYLPLQGFQAASLDMNSIGNLYSCRASLEGLAAREAAIHISKEQLIIIEESIILSEQFYQKGDLERTVEKNTVFHDTILYASKNRVLINLMEQIKTQILRFRTITSIYGFRPSFIEEHQEIFTLLSHHDQERVEQEMKKHVLQDLDTILAKLESN